MTHPIVFIGSGCITLAVGCCLFGIIAFFAARRAESITGARVTDSAKPPVLLRAAAKPLLAPSTGKAGGASSAAPSAHLSSAFGDPVSAGDRLHLTPPSTPLCGCNNTAAAWGRAAVYAVFILMTIANLAMIHALLGNDFSVSYVAHVGSRETPRWVSAISLWSSLEGSILFWCWVLAAYAATCIYIYRDREPRLMAWVGLTLLAVQLFFALLVAMPANPFLPVTPVPPNGPGPNPLLQNHWLMAIHPPCLYLGYIGFTVPFAFAVAALMESDRDGRWLHLSRRWTLFAWSFLSVAIMLGGWWSYAVLGWGGYWAWDPVENASFMPWLAGTALVHSIIVQEKRKMLPVWNLILAVVTFLLTLLGTFLTRSGVLESVHSFTESGVGPYFLAFIGCVLAVSVALLLWRAPFFGGSRCGLGKTFGFAARSGKAAACPPNGQGPSGPPLNAARAAVKSDQFRTPGRVEHLLSLEVLFLFNNLLFVSFCFIVFLGTWYPLIVEAVQGKRISIGQPYFNQMTVPLVGMGLLLMGVALITPWRRGVPRTMIAAARWPAVLAVGVMAVALALGCRHLLPLGMIGLSAFAFFVMKIEMGRVAWQRAGGVLTRLPGAMVGLVRDNPRRYGGFVAHIGALCVVVAVSLSATYKTEREMALKPGESADLAGYTLTLEGIEASDRPQRFEVRAVVHVTRDGKALGPLAPQLNYYRNSREPIATPAVRSTLLGDLYLAPINFAKDGTTASMRAIATPAVAWIWIGGLLVMLGGLLPILCNREKA